MLIKCPACGASASLDALIDDEPAAQALLSVLKITPVGRSIVKYLGLFRPEKRQLSWSKTASLLGELMPMIEAQSIKRSGISYDAPHHVWESAIEKVIEARNMGTLQTPLKTHGYLLEVLITEGKRLSDDNVKKAEAKKQAERAKHDQHLADLQKRQAEAKAETQPKPREKVVMPENIKKALREGLTTPIAKEKVDEIHNALKENSVPPVTKKPVYFTPEESKQRAHEAMQKELEKMTPEQKAEYYAMKNQHSIEQKQFAQELQQTARV